MHSSGSGMPFFKKKVSKENKHILERKLVIAQEKPDKVFDLTECGIYQVPEGTYSMCKVFQKEILLLQHNNLDSLKEGGNLEDLNLLKVIDLSYNKFTSLPKQIGSFTFIKKLDLSYNKLKKLPEQIGNLKNLEILLLKCNQLIGLPANIKCLQELMTLDISENKYLDNLPISLCYLRKLEVFNFDFHRVTYPPKEVTAKGFPEIRRWFMLIKGEEFAVEAAALQNTACQSSGNPVPVLEDTDSTAFQESIEKREKEKETKRMQQLELEKEILDAQTENALLCSTAAQQRQQVLSRVAFEEMRAQSETQRAYEETEGNRQKLLATLYTDENHLKDTVALVLQLTERARNTDALLDELEQDRERMDQLFRITQEESEKLRKEEVLKSMTYVLEELEKHQVKWDEYEISREKAARIALRSCIESNEGVEELLDERDHERTDLLQRILTEEEAQKEVFQVLQFQQDSKLTRIRKQVELIEAELVNLSMIELEKKQQREDAEMIVLAEMRINTAMVLTQLIDEQEKREQQLVKQLEAMEDHREDTAKDYWLVQFQRLLDSKPQILIDEENQLDVFVVDSLMNAGEKEYLPMFARRRINRTQMENMDDRQLYEIGVHDEVARHNILTGIQGQIKLHERTVQKRSLLRQNSMQAAEVPEFIADVSPIQTIVGSAEVDCVVCMDNKPDMIFLYCGHVCTCVNCAQQLEICPICRQDIAQKCRLFGT